MLSVTPLLKSGSIIFSGSRVNIRLSVSFALMKMSFLAHFMVQDLRLFQVAFLFHLMSLVVHFESL